ncbi:uncharacterized protein TNCV_3533921 [Trichonephila clavipes]|nr:uncharacterized protein TNCV_3533921 [Trichonephila clavipes]
MKEGLIPSRYECPKCKKDMRLVERKGTIDGFEWRCRVQSKENPHFICRSGTQQLETRPGCEETQKESIGTGPESVVANGGGTSLGKKNETNSLEGGKNCDVNGHTHPTDTHSSRRSQSFLSFYLCKIVTSSEDRAP